MEEIRINKIHNGYTIYQSGIGTIFYGPEEVIEAVKKLVK